MLNIAIVDDEIKYTNQMQEYIERYCEENDEKIKITAFSDGDQIVYQYKPKFDIIFMDVEMKFMDGMSAAEAIRKIDSEVVIIFVTNMPQYAIRGYAVEALDYLLKPVSYFAFSQCLRRAISRMNNRISNAVILNIKGGTARVNIKDIYYVESRGHNTIYHTLNDEYESISNMKETEDILSKMHFFRISKWYLVNLAHIDNFCDGYVKLGNYNLTVSRGKKREFLEALTSYWGEVIK